MTRRLALLTLKAYPLAFRRRYGEEMAMLLDQSPTRMTTLVDLLRGALAAHLRPRGGLAGFVSTSDRLRASTSGVLACWVVFAAAGVGFYKTTEHAPFSTAGSARLLLGGSHMAVQMLATIASCAVVAGALPLIWAALEYARRERSARRLVSLPLVAVIVFIALTGGFVFLAHRASAHHVSIAARGALIAWILAGWACAAICVLASRRALFTVPMAPRRLGAALIWGTVVTAAMGLIAVAVAVYTVVLLLDASRIADQSDGPWFISTSTWLSLTLQVMVMALSVLLATVTTGRGWRALRATESQRA
jgi:hypothetical protein